MPTLSFLLYGLCVAFVYFLRLHSRGWFAPFAFWSMVAVPLLFLLLAIPSMRALSLTLHADSHVTKGAKGTLQLCFKSRSWLPAARVRVLLRVENRFTGEAETRVLNCCSVDNSSQEIPFQTSLCGLLRFRVLRWECRDALGLFAVRKKAPAEVSCTVLPPAVSPETVPDWENALHTEARFKPKHGGGFSEEHDLREYRPGDPANSIHWKLSSKTDDLIVREALIQENQQIFLVLSHAGKEDRGLEILYWLSLELCRRELPHCIVSDKSYLVGNENDSVDALSGILSHPITTPCSFDPSSARCILYISGEEVSWR